MQVSQINNTTFNSKQRVLTESGLKNFNGLKKKMGDWSIITCTEFFVRSKLGYLNSGDVFYANLIPAEVNIGKSKLTISQDGEITIGKKPFLKSKKSLIKKLEEYLAFFNNNYYQQGKFEKNFLHETGFVDECDGKVYITKKEWLRN